MDAADVAWVLRGTVVSSRPDRTLSIRPDQLVVVNQRGYISHLEAADTAQSKALLSLVEAGQVGRERVVDLGEDGWVLPGFVDTHIHAPQYINSGMALDKPLMEWLEAYTLRAESRIDRDPHGLGARVYAKLVQRMLENGTTAASVFGTISVEANLVLAKAFLDAGLRGQIGKVAMDQHSIPTYVETTSSSLSSTRSFISAVRELVAPLAPEQQIVEPVVTPRFVPTCSMDLLRGLSDLARETGARIQSHMCESEGMVRVCKDMLGGKSDVAVLNELGLLNERSLMAHCTHTTAPDLALLASTGTAIASCPLSNVYFSSERQLPLREAWTAGVKVGLGSDISGGYRLGLDDNMRWAVGISRMREGQRDAVRVAPEDGEADEGSLAITWQESLFLATLGGAQALGLDGDERRVGVLEVGSAFDAQFIALGDRRSRVDWFDLADEAVDGQRDGEEGATAAAGHKVTLEEKVEKWWSNGSEVDRRAVWVQGRRVYERDES
ncbi:uncharacterized protein RHOBADRAFT_55799 [Rhodotorula graminis WP1]|uniref:Amidohydrolase-related domain-containing protein n=1 Tax=Rhodotorula graminis (strain WP1) TaxID=578459 RepID=A0A0P9ISD3_RHOGW|nr:uncharacterized protein RHOBADRAFT_55799 [Rhodotorula graminis WP1]KPV72314.1 hypothetical protein RHOBADRAFT_55799 [Rhodotorula graminis WP1]